jgi:hypothetical protein
MNRRNLLLVVYLVIFAAIFATMFILPSLSTLVFYGLLFWFIASFFVFRLPGLSGSPSGRGNPTGGPPSGSPGAPPLPSSPPVSLGFCAFCGRDLPTGSSICPGCGHAVRAF